MLPENVEQVAIRARRAWAPPKVIVSEQVRSSRLNKVILMSNDSATSNGTKNGTIS